MQPKRKCKKQGACWKASSGKIKVIFSFCLRFLQGLISEGVAARSCREIFFNNSTKLFGGTQIYQKQIPPNSTTKDAFFGNLFCSAFIV